MSKLLAKIKAVFAPTPPTPPPADVPAAPAAPVVMTAEPTPAEVPAAPVSPAPAVLAEPPSAVAERRAVIEEAPAAVPEPEPVAALDAAPTDGLTLRLESERANRSTFHVTKEGATIGRGPESTIQLADLSVSRKHARITFKQGAYWLSDLGSMGGTWIDGAKLAAPKRVATGQTIDIGLCRLVVLAAAEGEKTGAAKGPSNAA